MYGKPFPRPTIAGRFPVPDETVLVTGAGGFIGGRFAQRFVLEDRGAVRALVHRRAAPGAIRLARLPVEILEGSVTDPETVRDAVDGCDTVVNCAGGNRTAITNGTRTLLDAAMATDVDRFLHLSSAAVHGHGFEGVIDERARFSPDTSYAEWKATAERTIERRTAGADLAPTVFRPFIVYGPHSQFVLGPLEDIASGAQLADGGHGTVNQLYVDNLIDAMLRAMETPAAVGEAFLVADDEVLSWREYYRRLAGHLEGHPPVRSAPRWRVQAHNYLSYLSANVTPPFRWLARVATSPDVHRAALEEAKRMPWLMDLYASAPAGMRDRIRRFVGGDASHTWPRPDRSTCEPGATVYGYPSERDARQQTSAGRLSTRKAKEVLGWSPRIGVAEGMARVGAWLAYAEPLSGGAKSERLTREPWHAQP